MFWCGALCSFTDPSFLLLLHFRFPPAPLPPPPQMIVSTAALLFVRLSVLQSVSTGWPSTHSFCFVWLQVPPSPLPVCILICPSCLFSFLSPSCAFSILFSFFLFTSCFQLRWLQHGAFLIDLNEASPNKSFNLVAPPHFLSFFYSLTLYLSLTFSSLEVALCHTSTVPCSSPCIAWQVFGLGGSGGGFVVWLVTFTCLNPSLPCWSVACVSTIDSDLHLSCNRLCFVSLSFYCILLKWLRRRLFAYLSIQSKPVTEILFNHFF